MGGWKSIVIIVSLAVAGCCSWCKDEFPDTITVPCPKAPLRVKPVLAINDLRPDDAPDKVIKAYVLSVHTLIGKVNELELLLDGYR